MSKALTVAKIPDYLYSVCSYFLPRLMFLPSKYAAQIHWGDVAIALHDFPQEYIDLTSADFWENWMLRWVKLADTYYDEANKSTSEIGKRSFFRSAAACYHWAEFMYFSDATFKTQLRSKIKDCFEQSLDSSEVHIKFGTMKWNEIDIPYYLVLPKKINLSS